jgi:uncharacterized protein
MKTKIFMNLAVKDLGKARDFFEKLGFTFNPKFSDDKGACMVINENAYVMLLTEPFFQSFHQKKLVDAKTSTEVLTSISVEDKDRVNEFVEKAFSLGGTPTGETQDLGFMFSRAFNDLDGHIWEVFWMDMNAVNAGAAVSQ